MKLCSRKLYSNISLQFVALRSLFFYIINNRLFWKSFIVFSLSLFFLFSDSSLRYIYIYIYSKYENKEDIMINEKTKIILNKFLENPLFESSLSW